MFVYVRAHLFALLAIETAPPTHTHKHQHTHTQTDTKTYANTNTRIDRHTRSRIRRSIPVVSARRNTVRTAPPAPDRCPSLSPGAAAVHGRVAPGRYVCVRVCVCVCVCARARVRMSCVGGDMGACVCVCLRRCPRPRPRSFFDCYPYPHPARPGG